MAYESSFFYIFVGNKFSVAIEVGRRSRKHPVRMAKLQAYAFGICLEFGHYIGSGGSLEAGFDGLKTQVCRLEQFGILDSLLTEQRE